MFNNLNNPEPFEIKQWLKETKLSISQAANALGISNRQFSRLVSGETSAKKMHALAMQMVWLTIEENKEQEKYCDTSSGNKSIQIPIK
tara:strand:- start:398 stop:661 length:264 start_codon:yes stop_codon:yes gene_type:complete